MSSITHLKISFMAQHSQTKICTRETWEMFLAPCRHCTPDVPVWNAPTIPRNLFHHSNTPMPVLTHSLHILIFTAFHTIFLPPFLGFYDWLLWPSLPLPPPLILRISCSEILESTTGCCCGTLGPFILRLSPHMLTSAVFRLYSVPVVFFLLILALINLLTCSVLSLLP